MNSRIYNMAGSLPIIILKWSIFFIIILILAVKLLAGGNKPPSLEDSKAEPVKYVGSQQTDKRFYHGKVRPAVGVHKYQAFRANRSQPPEIGSDAGWTYNHQPYLAYWNGRFYHQYLSNLKEAEKNEIRYQWIKRSIKNVDKLIEEYKGKMRDA